LARRCPIASHWQARHLIHATHGGKLSATCGFMHKTDPNLKSAEGVRGEALGQADSRCAYRLSKYLQGLT
jgi:hypothetical protein